MNKPDWPTEQNPGDKIADSITKLTILEILIEQFSNLYKQFT